MNQQRAQVRIPALADPQQLGESGGADAQYCGNTNGCSWPNSAVGLVTQNGPKRWFKADTSGDESSDARTLGVQRRVDLGEVRHAEHLQSGN